MSSGGLFLFFSFSLVVVFEGATSSWVTWHPWKLFSFLSSLLFLIWQGNTSRKGRWQGTTTTALAALNSWYHLPLPSLFSPFVFHIIIIILDFGASDALLFPTARWLSLATNLIFIYKKCKKIILLILKKAGSFEKNVLIYCLDWFL